MNVSKLDLALLMIGAWTLGIFFVLALFFGSIFEPMPITADREPMRKGTELKGGIEQTHSPQRTITNLQGGL